VSSTKQQRPGLAAWARRVIAATSAATVLIAVAAVPASAQMTEYLVNDTSDAGDANKADGDCKSTNSTTNPPFVSCTLRAAMWEAVLKPLPIRLPPGVYHLTIPPGGEASGPSDLWAGDLDTLSGTITIKGAGVRSTIIDGGNSTRIFDVHEHTTLELSKLSLETGKADFDRDSGHTHGGAIHNHGTLRLEQVSVNRSTSSSAGGLWGGGGITNAAGATATLINVTVAENSTNAQGGGIENKGTLGLAYTTITDNSAPAANCPSSHVPTGIPHGAWRPPRPCEVNHGGGLYLAPGSHTSVVDTIVAGNHGHDCQGSGSVTSLGGNVQGDGSCPFNHATDRTADPEFDPSAFPGPPRWYPLLPTSPAVDVPTTVLCYPGVLPDIIGTPRPLDGNGDGVALCDSGSAELDVNPFSSLSIADARSWEGPGAAGGRRMRFTVVLSAARKYPIKVRVATRDRTAHAGRDYVAQRRTLTFKPHQRRRTFGVRLIGDRTRERRRAFTVHLSAPKGARIADADATGTIIDDD
jgi:hypothetical protein